MASKQPIVKQVAWMSMVPQLIILSFFIVIASYTGTESPAIIGALAYLSASVILKKTIPSDHRKGMVYFKKEEFGQALERFLSSYDFFNRYKWIDDWRYITLLSSSRISYREMALLNAAYCYGQIGEGAKAREYYQRTLEEFPGSAMAKAALRMLDSSNPNPGP